MGVNEIAFSGYREPHYSLQTKKASVKNIILALLSLLEWIYFVLNRLWEKVKQSVKRLLYRRTLRCVFCFQGVPYTNLYRDRLPSVRPDISYSSVTPLNKNDKRLASCCPPYIPILRYATPINSCYVTSRYLPYPELRR